MSHGAQWRQGPHRECFSWSPAMPMIHHLSTVLLEKKTLNNINNLFQFRLVVFMIMIRQLDHLTSHLATSHSRPLLKGNAKALRQESMARCGRRLALPQRQVAVLERDGKKSKCSWFDSQLLSDSWHVTPPSLLDPSGAAPPTAILRFPYSCFFSEYLSFQQYGSS